jgi:hypothetical protein
LWSSPSQVFKIVEQKVRCIEQEHQAGFDLHL